MSVEVMHFTNNLISLRQINFISLSGKLEPCRGSFKQFDDSSHSSSFLSVHDVKNYSVWSVETRWSFRHQYEPTPVSQTQESSMACRPTNCTLLCFGVDERSSLGAQAPAVSSRSIVCVLVRQAFSLTMRPPCR